MKRPNGSKNKGANITRRTRCLVRAGCKVPNADAFVAQEVSPEAVTFAQWTDDTLGTDIWLGSNTIST